MKLPKQAKPVMRTISTAKIEKGIGRSGLCEVACNLIPNATLKATCLAACKIV